MKSEDNRFMRIGLKLDPTTIWLNQPPSEPCPCNSETVFVDVLIPDVDWVDPIRVDIGYIGSYTVYGNNFHKLNTLYISGTTDVFDSELPIPNSTYTGVQIAYTMVDANVITFDAPISLTDGFFTLIMVDDDDNIIKWTDQDSGFGVKVGLGFDDPPIPHECPELIIRSDVDWVRPISVDVLDPNTYTVYGDDFTNLKHVYVSGTTGVFNGEVNIPNSSFTGILVNHTILNNTHLTLESITTLTDGYFSLVMVDIDDVVYKWTNQFVGDGVKSGDGFGDAPLQLVEKMDIDWVDPIHIPINSPELLHIFGSEMNRLTELYVSPTSGVLDNLQPIPFTNLSGVSVGYNILSDNEVVLTDDITALDNGYLTMVGQSDDQYMITWTNPLSGHGVKCGNGFSDYVPPYFVPEQFEGLHSASKWGTSVGLSAEYFDYTSSNPYEINDNSYIKMNDMVLSANIINTKLNDELHELSGDDTYSTSVSLSASYFDYISNVPDNGVGNLFDGTYGNTLTLSSQLYVFDGLNNIWISL